MFYTGRSQNMNNKQIKNRLPIGTIRLVSLTVEGYLGLVKETFGRIAPQIQFNTARTFMDPD